MQKIILFLPCIFLNIVLPIQRVNAEENNVFFSNVWLNGIDKNIETLVFYPDFKKHKRAYHFRNRQIVIQSDLIVAFWNGYSTGTKYTINFAKTLEKEVIVVKY